MDSYSAWGCTYNFPL